MRNQNAYDLTSAPASFIIAAKASAGTAAVQMLADGGAGFVQQLKNYSGIDVEVVDSYSSTAKSQVRLAGTGSAPTDTLLVRMDESKGAMLQRQSMQYPGPVIVDQNLTRIMRWGWRV